VLILCSDGFWERLKPEEIAELVITPRNLRSVALEKALQLAVDRGQAKADNASVIMIHLDGADCPPPSGIRWGSWLIFVLFVANLIAWWLVWKRSMNLH
jgi:hypothetical protein